MPILMLSDTPVEVPAGTLLSDAVLPHHALGMPCAGKGRCGKCRIQASGALSPLCEVERAHLTPAELADGIRLACCTRVVGDARATLAAQDSGQIRTDGVMPQFTQNPLFTHYGVAIDIGTTTLAAQLYSVQGLLAQASAPNPQASFGADVISRIEHALAGKGQALAECICGGLNDLLHDLCAQAVLAPSSIDALVITGNTAMLHLLTQTSPACLSHAPFVAERLFGETLPAASLGLCCSAASVYLPRCMSAFVGADITTALLASDLCSSTHTALLADIGTNGEMALWHGGQLLCCSTAAGPAFEGAGLSMGMAGKRGAVDHVEVANGTLHAHVIGDAAPTGICGSGIVDALACLLQTEQMDETGLLDDDPTFVAPPVALTQADVRAVQLAKSAVCAGMQTLLQLAQVPPESLSQLAIAGGFGSYLNIASAAAIGLVPPALQEKAHAIGNAALSGAAMLLLNRDFIPIATQLAAMAETVELSTSPVFMDRYVENMLF